MFLLFVFVWLSFVDNDLSVVKEWTELAPFIGCLDELTESPFIVFVEYSGWTKPYLLNRSVCD